MPCYSVYGLTLCSNRELPGLVAAPLSDPTACELTLELGTIAESITSLVKTEPPWYVSPDQNEDETPNLSVWRIGDGVHFWFSYDDGIEFVLSASRIWARWPDHESLESAATYLLGPVLGFWLRWRGITCLHASAVAIEGQAVLFVGAGGAGKSTTAAALARLGYPVLCDDLVALTEQNQQFSVQPGYPGLRLWADSTEALFNSGDALPRLVPAHPTWDKRYLDLQQPGYYFQSQPLPLAAIYLLNERTFEATRPSIETVSPRAELLNLIANTYASYLLSKNQRAQEFELLSRLLKQTPLKQLNPHADPARLPQLCDTILTDFHQSPD